MSNTIFGAVVKGAAKAVEGASTTRDSQSVVGENVRPTKPVTAQKVVGESTPPVTLEIHAGRENLSQSVVGENMYPTKPVTAQKVVGDSMTPVTPTIHAGRENAGINIADLLPGKLGMGVAKIAAELVSVTPVSLDVPQQVITGTKKPEGLGKKL